MKKNNVGLGVDLRIFALLFIGIFSFINFINVEALTGSGTSEEPYQITSCADFMDINDDLDAYYELTTDIDCTLDGNSIMVATSTDFTGNFDGGGYEITIELTPDDNTSVVGLFAETGDATISNLTLSGSIVGTNISSVGMLVGRAQETTFNNITVDVDLTFDFDEELGAGDGVGGLIGVGYEVILEDVAASGTINATSSDEVGGVIGTIGCVSEITDSSSAVNVIGDEDVGGFLGFDGCEGYGSIVTDSYATGNVTGSETVGGFAGEVYYVTYDNVYATGDVTATEESYVGGLIGYIESDGGNQRKIFQSYATGNVIGIYDVGGLIGHAEEITISQSYATGNVTGDENVGGLIGHLDDDSTVRDSYARGDVDGEYDVGGFFGNSEDDVQITTSYSANAVDADDDFGGFGGGNDEDLTTYGTLFWDSELAPIEDACYDDSNCATGKTTAEMKTASTFTAAEWNFDDIWQINPGINDGYPSLRGGDDEVYVPEQAEGPVETILDENQFEGGGVAQNWNQDDGEWEYELPFTFNFYGIDYDTVYVSSNGYVTFDDGFGDYGFDIDDVDAPVIMALQDDLVTNVSDGEDGYLTDIYITDNGDGKVVFRWVAADIEDNDVILNFEIVLHDDDTFQFNYGEQLLDLNSDYAAVGVQDGILSYVASEYNDRNNFNNLNTSYWNYTGEEPEPESEEEPRRKKGTSVKKRVENLVKMGDTQKAEELKDEWSHLFDSTTQTTQTQSGETQVRDLELGMEGSDVKLLQQLLNAQGYLLAETGVGSIGNETEYFGTLTQNALIKYQAANNISPAAGYFGSITRAQMKAALLEGLWW